MAKAGAFHSLWQDVRFGARLLARSPGFAVLAVLILALGIGTVSAAFVLADAVFLRPWPGRDPGSLVQIYKSSRQERQMPLSWPECRDVAGNASAFSGVLGYERHAGVVGASKDAPLVLDDWVSRNYFAVLGMPLARGRGFSAQPEHELTAVIGYDVWREELGGKPGVIGKTILFNHRKVVVIGVAPRGFHGLSPFIQTHLWLPADDWLSAKELADRTRGDIHVVGRMQSGAAVAGARGELASLGDHLAAAFPATNRDTTLTLETLAEYRKSRLPASLIFLLGPAAIVLLIACGNVAGLLLARAEARRREIAIRLALGATRVRLVRQLLTESCLLALPAAGLGLLLVRWLMMLEPALLPPVGITLGGPSLRLDARALGFALLATVAAVLIFGLAPALSARKGDLVSAGKGGSAAPASHSGRKIGRGVLVVAQIALATTVLTAGGLLLRSFLYSSQLNPGFDVHGRRLIFSVSLGGGPQGKALQSELAALRGKPNTAEARAALVAKAMESDRAALRERVLGLPGVRGAVWCQRFPLSGIGGGVEIPVEFSGDVLPRAKTATEFKYNSVDPGYFHLLGTRLLAGRSFNETDTANSEPVAIVSQTMARRYWPTGDALGHEILAEGKRITIVGIAEDVKVNSLHESPQPYLYFPLAQHNWGEPTFVVQTAQRGGPSIETLRNAMRAVDPGIYFISAMPVQQLMSDALWQDSLLSGISGVVAGMGILLAAVGLFAVIDYSVRRRIPEFGVRMAMGAQPGDVLGIVLRMGLWLALAGCALGLAAGFAVSRLLRSALYGVTPGDPVTYILVAALLVVVALAASLLPARRATRVDPAKALRWE